MHADADVSIRRRDNIIYFKGLPLARAFSPSEGEVLLKPMGVSLAAPQVGKDEINKRSASGAAANLPGEAWSL